MSILKTYDPTKVNVTYKGRQLRMFGDNLFTLARDEVIAICENKVNNQRI